MTTISQFDSLAIGTKYNHWTILEYLGKSRHGKDIYLCQCECEEVREVEGRSLVKGLSKSCGCIKKVSKDIQKQKRKEYKAQYFQENKDRIYERIKSKPTDKSKRVEYYLKSKYKTTIEEIQTLYSEQQGKCFICGQELNISWLLNNGEPDEKEGCTMVIDHNHKTGKVRGLLCFNCNVGLGMFKDNIKSLKMAIKYLEKEKKE